MKIYQDSRGKAPCKSCNAPLEWAELVSGKRHPFNDPIIVVPTLTPELDGTRVVQTVDHNRTVSHFATCPDHKRWRKKKP